MALKPCPPGGPIIGVTIADVEGVPIPLILSILQSAKVYFVPAVTATTLVTAPPVTTRVNVAAVPPLTELSPCNVCAV